MKKLTLILLLVMTTTLSAKWSYYLVDLTKISISNFNLIKTKLNEYTDNRYDLLNYYVLNNDTLLTSTRIIIECDDKIEQYTLVQTGISNGIIQKIRTSEYVYDGHIKSVKDTILLDYLNSNTSWFLLNSQGE